MSINPKYQIVNKKKIEIEQRKGDIQFVWRGREAGKFLKWVASSKIVRPLKV